LAIFRDELQYVTIKDKGATGVGIFLLIIGILLLGGVVAFCFYSREKKKEEKISTERLLEKSK
jgi:hypothetical protein